MKELYVVSYRNSTSNHNSSSDICFAASLYLIEILHQTTTSRRRHKRKKALYLIEILHQTTTLEADRIRAQLLYLIDYLNMPVPVVSYRNSTSNHNFDFCRYICAVLYLIEILHQTTTRRVVSSMCKMLYLIEILHQTTTSQRTWKLS